jgi:hypothetical protein
MTITLNGTTGIDTPAITNNGAYTGDGVVFADATPANTLVTTTGGNVGIGTSSPTTKLSVVSATNAGISVNDGTVNTIVYNSTGGVASIGTTTNHPVDFYANNSARMRLDSSGNLLVGTTSGSTATNENGVSIGGSSGDIVLRKEAGVILFLRRWGTNGTVVDFRNTANTSVGSISTGASSTTYATSSDYRLKENIAPMTGALVKVTQLKPVTYTWKADGSSGEGFIAHELAEVVPDCVTGEKDAVDEEGKPVYQGIDTSFLVATLTAAIQELKAELDTVKTELATLKGTV